MKIRPGVKKYISEVVGRDATLLGRAPDSSGQQNNKAQENTETVQEDDFDLPIVQN